MHIITYVVSGNLSVAYGRSARPRSLPSTSQSRQGDAKPLCFRDGSCFFYYDFTGWWFGTFVIFPYIGNNDPNWLIFFRGVETTSQFTMILRLMEWYMVYPEGTGIWWDLMDYYRTIPLRDCENIHDWLLVSNMAFVFHNIWDNPNPIDFHIFQDGLKPPTRLF